MKNKKENKLEIKQLDSAIEKIPNDFIGEDGKVRNEIRYAFIGAKNTPYQGMKLRHYRNSRAKLFVVQYKLGKKTLSHTLGTYNFGQYGISDAQKDMMKLREKYGHPNNNSWTCNITTAIELKKIQDNEELAEKLLKDAENKTINEVLVTWLNAGAPKSKRKGKLTSSTLKSALVQLLGKHERRDYIRLEEKLNGEADLVITHPKAKTLDELLKIFPSEMAEINHASRSIYDNPIGQYKIKDLTRTRLKDYMRLFGIGNQRNIASVMSQLWNYAQYQEWLGLSPSTNPTINIKIEMPDTVNEKNYLAKYSKQSYTDEQIQIIWDLCDKFRDEYPFQTQLIKLILITGLRFQEASKITTSMIDHKLNQITLYGTITKQRKNRVISITPLLQKVLDDIYAQKEKDHLSWSLFVDWLFPSNRFNKSILNQDQSEKIRSHASRLKGIKQLLEKMSELAGFKIVAKVLRNTYQTKANDLIDKDWDVIQITGHADTKTLQDNYLSRKLTKTVVANADMISENYENIITLSKKSV